jgi:diguanylate cyclase (GGDEF)-like protein
MMSAGHFQMDTVEHSDTAARGRRLVQHAAVLLYADRPLDDFLSQLARVLKETFSSSAFFVWLSKENGDLALRYGSDETERRRGLARHCAQSGRSLKTQDGERSEMYAPITYGGGALGVAAVVSDATTTYTDEDLRLFESITHYIAIAIGNQNLVRSVVLPYRRARQLVVLLLCAAVLASLVIAGFAFVHAQQLGRTSVASAQMQVNAVAERLEAHANDAGQLARSLAVLGAAVRADRNRTQSILSKMLQSGPRSTIYGAGLWYAPYAYDGHTRLFGPYVHRGKSDPRRIVLTYFWSSPSYDYPSKPWYRLAADARDQTRFTQPYFDTDLVYITAAQAMRDQAGRFIGVATVDMSLPYLQRLIQSLSTPNRVFYIATDNNRTFVYPDARGLVQYARQRGTRTASVTSVPVSLTKQYIAQQFGGPRVDTSANIALLGWTLHESEDAMTLGSLTNSVWMLTAFALMALWISTGLGVGAILQSRKQVFDRIRLELEHSRLRNEVEQRIAAEQRLVETSKNDPLTGLPARVALLDAVAAALDERRTNPQAQYAIAFLDLDRFGTVNEALGHSKGDEVLRALAERLVRSCAGNCVVGRYGGDEFLLIKRISDRLDAVELAKSVLSSLGEAFAAGGESVFVRASMGIVIPDEAYKRPDQVVRDADTAMSRAKSKGTLRFEIFNPEMRARAEQRVRMEAQLRHALTRDDFFVEYQPIVQLDEERIEGFEALVRWHPEAQSIMYPAQFVDSAERIGAIVPIDFKVLRSARRDFEAWRPHDGTRGSPLYVAVNMSALHFATRGLAQQLIAAIREQRFPENTLHIEITETALIRDSDIALEALAELRADGVAVSIDDFGTGYSALSYLERFRVDAVKIDKSFVEAITQQSRAAEVVRAITALGRALCLDVIAEGVETLEQIRLLREAGVSRGQGYVFSPPVGPATATQLLIQGIAVAR